MQIGVDSFGAVISDPATGLTLSPVQRIQNLLEEIVLADHVGLDVFGVGETTAVSSWTLPQSSFLVQPLRAQTTFALQAPSLFSVLLTRSACSRNLPRLTSSPTVELRSSPAGVPR
jgi:hypothetical protein